MFFEETNGPDKRFNLEEEGGLSFLEVHILLVDS